MKIVSLLPSATEIVFALGLGDQVAGVSYECDHPPEARTKPVISGTALPIDQGLTARQIDDEVSTRIARGEPIYTLATETIRAIQPDLILAQDLCRVCAVPAGAVQEALDQLGCHAQVLSLDPATLDGVLTTILAVGDATGTADQAKRTVERLRQRLTTLEDLLTDERRPRTFALEWSDPPFSGGHWIPGVIQAAGGEPLLQAEGQPSRRLEWATIGEAEPEIVVFMPCGYHLAEAVAEGRRLLDVPELDHARIVAVDANAYFSRPGPRVVDGAEILAAALHPGLVPEPPPDTIAVIR